MAYIEIRHKAIIVCAGVAVGLFTFDVMYSTAIPPVYYSASPTLETTR